MLGCIVFIPDVVVISVVLVQATCQGEDAPAGGTFRRLVLGAQSIAYEGRVFERSAIYHDLSHLLADKNN